MNGNDVAQEKILRVVKDNVNSVGRRCQDRSRLYL